MTWTLEQRAKLSNQIFLGANTILLLRKETAGRLFPTAHNLLVWQFVRADRLHFTHVRVHSLLRHFERPKTGDLTLQACKSTELAMVSCEGDNLQWTG